MDAVAPWAPWETWAPWEFWPDEVFDEEPELLVPLSADGLRTPLLITKEQLEPSGQKMP